MNMKTNLMYRSPPSARRLVVGALGGLALCAITVSVQAQDLNETLRKKNCFACHAWDKKLVGPAYSAVRARYSASDLPQLVAKVLNGGGGVWGPVPMPSNRPWINPAEAQFLVAGILGVAGGMPLPSSPVTSPPLPAASPAGPGGSTRTLGGGD